MTNNKSQNNGMMTFGGHLEVLRQMLFRVIAVAGFFSIIIFCLKDITWRFLLAPSEWDFITYRIIESFIHWAGIESLAFERFHVDLIATGLSSQFMNHVTTSVTLGLLGASPYILYELFRYISPALYDNEKRYSIHVAVIIYVLFIFGVLISYYILFPISFRFLGTYSVAERVHSSITIDSYVSTFTSLTLMMGLVFQLPVIAFILAKIGIVQSWMLAQYRRHALICIMMVSAIITPPDLMTLTIVSIPLYMLYEISIVVIKKVEIQ